MKKPLLALLPLLVVTGLISCSLPIGFTPTPTQEITLVPMPTETPTPQVPTNTPEPTFTLTAMPTFTPQVYSQIKAKVTVQILNMRDGPGATFNVVQKLPEGASIWILGRAKGNDWFLVRDESNHAGWVAAEFVYITTPITQIPFFAVTDAVVITGKAVDDQQNPIPGVDFAVYPANSSGQVRTDVYSDESGNFYAYLPTSAGGAWTIEIVGIMCTSPIMDSNCKHSGQFKTTAYTIMILDDAAIPLVFEYKP